MEKPVISIVIPAYNAETTIERTVESIWTELHQMVSFEVLVVENGSTDNTLKKIKEIQSEYSDIRVLKSKKGVCNARNFGMTCARAPWIMFVDADDSLIKGSGKIIKRAVNNLSADICFFGYQIGNSRRTLCKKLETYEYESDKIENFRAQMLSHPTRYMQVWAKLFKKEIITNNHIEFDQRLRLAEDSDFTLMYTRYCKKIVLYPECIYSYNTCDNSTMRTMDWKKAQDYMWSMEVSGRKIEGESLKIQKAYQQYVMTHFHIAMVNEVFSKKNPAGFGEQISSMKQLADQDIFKRAINECCQSGNSKINFLIGYLFKWHLTVIAGVIYKIRAKMK